MIDPVFNTNNYETTAGYIELSIRFLWMLWFVFELKNTFSNLETVASFDVDTVMTDLPDDGDDTVDFQTPDTKNRIKYSRLKDNDDRDESDKDGRLKSLQVFYLHFGACSLVWFIYMPVLIFITSFVSELYRMRLVLGIRYLINYLTVLLLFFIMRSPTSPLKLPGKKPSVRSDIVSRYLFFEGPANGENEQEEEVLFTRGSS